MRSRAILVTALGLAMLTPGVGRAGPDAVIHGVTSANVEHLSFVPFEPVLATGAHIVDDYLYVTSSKNITIYDVSDPLNPELVSYTPFPTTRWENEDVATNGSLLIFSQTGVVPLVGGAQNALRVYDVTDKANPVEIAAATGLGQHTMTCVDDCRFLYGSGGSLIDLRTPTNPASAGSWSTIAGVSGGHDVREDAPGVVVNSSGSSTNCPGAILDTTDPLQPKRLSCMPTSGATGRPAEYMHSSAWANQATDRFMIVASETNLAPRCNAGGTGNGATYVYDMSNWQSGTYTRTDRMQGRNGMLFDGNPPANALGCSAHWLEPSPAFRNGGVFAQGYYEHGTRFFYVNGAGKLREVGFFVPFGGSTSAAHWVTDRIVYAIDYTRGIDILRWNGPLPNDPDAQTGVDELGATPEGSVTGTATFLGEATPNVLADDPLGDGPVAAEHTSNAGVDITEASVYQPDATYPELVFTWKVSNLPNPVTGMQPENVRYVWSFLAGGKEWFVQAKASNLVASTTPDDPPGTVTKTMRAFQLRGNCQTIGGVLISCGHVAWLDGSFDAANKTVSVRVPIGAQFAPEIQAGTTITPTTSPADDLYAALQVVADNNNTRDLVTYETSYTVPQRTVALGVAPAGTDPGQVTFGTPIVVGSDGSFSANLGPIPAGSEVFAKACFGNTCGPVLSAAAS